LEPDEYHTIQAPCKGLFKAKGSKHFGFVYPIQSEEEVAPLLAGLRKEFHDARHHAYAFRIGPEVDRWRTSDDGEPSNSAGPPILGALRSRKLTGCLAVVVRYFGGTKLGVGGLIEAYREATLAAIGNGTIETRYILQSFTIQCPFDLIGAVMSQIEKHDGKIQEQEFTLDVRLKVDIRTSVSDAFEDKIRSLYGCQIAATDEVN